MELICLAGCLTAGTFTAVGMIEHWRAGATGQALADELVTILMAVTAANLLVMA